MSKSKVLLVCLTFPPMRGVGARRWVKISKQLLGLGLDLTIISGTAANNETSPWTDDISGMNIIRLPNLYPSSLIRPAVGLIAKLIYRLELLRVKFRTKANYYDRGMLWAKQFNSTVNKIVSEKEIGTLIVTGGPFSFLYYGAKFKERNPGINYIADIRDDWTNDNFYGFGGLSESRKIAEMQRLSLVLKIADSILVPYPSMAKKYSKMEPLAMGKIKVLPHGVDETKLAGGCQTTSSDIFRLVYFGSIHSGQDQAFRDIAKSLVKLEDVHITFYSIEKKYISEFKQCINQVQYLEPINDNEVFQVMKQANAALLFIPEYFRDNLATKFMETIGNRTPIFAIGFKGEVSEFIVNNRLGVFIEYHRVGDEFESKIQEIVNIDYNYEFDFTPYTFRKQAIQIMELIH